MLTFGPLPSRRLGRSLGINNIQPKTCSYACVYCQVGRRTRMSITRQKFFTPEAIYQSVNVRLNQLADMNEQVDYIAFVPDGEPTLDVNLREAIQLLQNTHHKIALICNASLLWREDVRSDLLLADWVSVKIDSALESSWRKINRPHRKLALSDILEGVRLFTGNYTGTLTTETMLVKECNDSDDSLHATAQFIKQLHPATCYLSLPTRPPSESWVASPDALAVQRAYSIFTSYTDVVCLFDWEGTRFTQTSNVIDDLLSIIAVHPMREEAVLEFLAQAGVTDDIVTKLIVQRKISKLEYQGHIFYKLIQF